MQYHAEPNRSAPDDNNSQAIMAAQIRVGKATDFLRAKQRKAAQYSRGYAHGETQREIGAAEVALAEAKAHLAMLLNA